MASAAFVLVAALVFLSGCAGVDPSRLTSYQQGQTILIAPDFAYVKSIGSNHFAYTLKAGNYVPKYRSASGAYYEGPGQCLTEKVSTGSAQKGTLQEFDSHSFRCGIFVNDKTHDAVVYFYRDPALSQPVDSGALINALNDAEMNNIHMHAYQPPPGELRRAISFVD